MLLEQFPRNEISQQLNEIEKTISSMSYESYAHALLDIPHCKEEISKILHEVSLYNFDKIENIPTIFSLIRTVFVMPDRKNIFSTKKVNLWV